MKTQTKQSQSNLSPKEALRLLVDGNDRFINSKKSQRNLHEQVQETSSGQYPFAVVLSCIDSRVPVELVFDQGIGDVFSVRVAGNIVNEDVLGSIEYGCKVAGSKVVVVLGHTKCGAVTAACNHVELGNITALLNKIKPSVNVVEESQQRVEGEKASAEFVEEVAELNISASIETIRKDSPILAEMVKNGEINLVGAVYSVETGEVKFL